ncbi:MAG: 1-(5-phosphoribosyl)-5-[(5-phosphoribosylamino)methylideneamino] imidazole-4-carboxamide isomerase [Thermoplasmatales archaeon Gpl]|nr:MAG: 1-(5-phosphoribosyl)-5-[(5-phosphoribosylamino)methylideneamino] imidazole-4-carboxamide isomerase [Thermoplasmatales archaeon Gpl]
MDTAWGGIRTMENIKDAFDAGVSAVILGTSAADAVFLQKASEKFPGITVSLDSRGMKAATKGWVQNSDLSVISLFENSRKYVKRFIYTDVEKTEHLVEYMILRYSGKGRR